MTRRWRILAVAAAAGALLLPAAAAIAAFTATTQTEAGTFSIASPGVCGTTNAALGRPATASSIGNGYPAARAVDGDTGSRWESDFSDPQWIRVDLGSSKTICRVVLNWENAAGEAFQVQTSPDGTAWTDIYSTTTGTGGVQMLNVSSSGRYVRMYGTARTTVYGFSLWEFEVYTTAPDDALLSQGKPTTASSTQNAGTGAALATDGDTGNTRWASEWGVDPQWLQVDLGHSATVTRLTLFWEAAYASSYQVQTSPDGSVWTDIYSTTTGVGGTQTFDVAGTGRYARVLGTARGTAFGYSLYEFQVFGSLNPSYPDTVLDTPGLASYWRLGESAVSVDTFSTGGGGLITSRSGETGATWTAEDVNSDTATITPAGRVRKSGANTLGAAYYASGVPASANYTVEADVYVASILANDAVAVVGRADLSTTRETFYIARYEQMYTAWILYRVNNDVWTWLGQSSSQPLTALTTYRLTLDMFGSSIQLLVNGVERVAANDAAPLTLVGRGGVAMGFLDAITTTVTDSTGMHLDNFRIDDGAADSAATSDGRYLGGPALSKAGAITGDTDTAALFDGVNERVRTPARVLSDFSVEFWFKSTQGIGTGAMWYDGAALVDSSAFLVVNDWGTSLRADGRLVAGVGNPDTSIISVNGGYNDGAWHHVVFTRNSTTGEMVLYVDGSSTAGNTGTGPTGPRDSGTDIVFGRHATHLAQQYDGFLDEVSIYSVVLNQATVTAHRNAGL